MENVMNMWSEDALDTGCFSKQMPYLEETVTELRNRGYKISTTACQAGYKKNLVALKAYNFTSIEQAVRIGDSIKDAREAKNAGMPFVGIIEGSALMQMTKEEYDTLSDSEKEAERVRIANAYKGAGADYVIRDIRWLLELLQ